MSGPSIPSLYPDVLPIEERQNGTHLVVRLQEWGVYISNFAYALRLIDFADARHAALFAERQELVTKIGTNAITVEEFRAGESALRMEMSVFEGWASMALRDAAMMVFHFDHVLDSIVKTTRTTPTVLSYVDTQKLNKAQPLFEKYFPKSRRMRNAVGHMGEISKTPRHQEKNQTTDGYASSNIYVEPGAKLLINSIRDGRSLIATFENDTVSMTLTQAQLKYLNEIQAVVFEAFAPLSLAMIAAALQRRPLEQP